MPSSADHLERSISTAIRLCNSIHSNVSSVPAGWYMISLKTTVLSNTNRGSSGSTRSRRPQALAWFGGFLAWGIRSGEMSRFYYADCKKFRIVCFQPQTFIVPVRAGFIQQCRKKKCSTTFAICGDLVHQQYRIHCQLSEVTVSTVSRSDSRSHDRGQDSDRRCRTGR